MKKFFAILCFILLTGCSHVVIRYVEPALNEPIAKLRIITNSGVSAAKYPGCLERYERMASAGRMHHGKMNPAYPSIPATTKLLDMPKRRSPLLPEIWDGFHFAEGFYAEVVAEYYVPANIPIVISGDAAKGMASWSSFYECKSQKRMYKFEANKNYEALIGLGLNTVENKVNACYFIIYPLNDSDEDSLFPLAFSEPPKNSCSLKTVKKQEDSQ